METDKAVVLHDAREDAIARLTRAFSDDRIGVEELESRMALAHRATSVGEVERVVSDLVDAPQSAALAPFAPERMDRALRRGTITAVFGGVERGGRWIVPRRVRIVAVCGGVELDLRDAVFLPGLTEIHVRAVLGGVHVIVPPGLSVDVCGSAILGGFARVDRAPAAFDPERPLLRVRGRATLGGVAVETRLRGESEGDAHRRRRFAHPALGRYE
jgi:hypothetical protein